MRKWNGLLVKEKVLYNKKVYLLTKLYIHNEKRVCDLTSLDSSDEEDLKGISIYECIRLKV